MAGSSGGSGTRQSPRPSSRLPEKHEPCSHAAQSRPRGLSRVAWRVARSPPAGTAPGRACAPEPRSRLKAGRCVRLRTGSSRGTRRLGDSPERLAHHELGCRERSAARRVNPSARALRTEPARSSCLSHLGGVLLLQVGRCLVQIRCLIVRGGRAQMRKTGRPESRDARQTAHSAMRGCYRSHGALLHASGRRPPQASSG